MKRRLGEVILTTMMFHQAGGSKVRPAVVLLDTGDNDFVGAPVTSQTRFSEFDVPIGDWAAAGLNVPSFIRVHKLTVLPKTDILRSLGTLADLDKDALIQALNRAFRG